MKKKLLIALMCLPTLFSPYILGRVKYAQAKENIQALMTYPNWGSDADINAELKKKGIITANIVSAPTFIELYKAGLK